MRPFDINIRLFSTFKNYLIGGLVDGRPSDKVYELKENSLACIGTLPFGVYNSEALIMQNTLFLLGGRTAQGNVHGTLVYDMNAHSLLKEV